MNEPAQRCPACSAELPSAFPGASIVCVCGQRVDLLPARSSGAPSPLSPKASTQPPTSAGAGPYRSAGGVHEAAILVTPCPYCGNACPPMVRICPHCDVRLDSVRCQRCFSLQAPGAFSCARCAHPLELEPLLDATDAPCPRCVHPLEVSPAVDTRVHECPRCGGIFVPRELLAEILCNAEIGGALREGAPKLPAESSAVRYIPCPLCHASMNRVNFGKVSGVIVDVCKPHGTWFDAGELTRVVAFAAGGGLEKTRARESQEKRDEAHQAAQAHVHPVGSHEARHFLVFDAQQQMETRLSMWQGFLRAVLSW